MKKVLLVLCAILTVGIVTGCSFITPDSSSDQIQELSNKIDALSAQLVEADDADWELVSLSDNEINIVSTTYSDTDVLEITNLTDVDYDSFELQAVYYGQAGELLANSYASANYLLANDTTHITMSHPYTSSNEPFTYSSVEYYTKAHVAIEKIVDYKDSLSIIQANVYYEYEYDGQLLMKVQNSSDKYICSAGGYVLFYKDGVPFDCTSFYLDSIPANAVSVSSVYVPYDDETGYPIEFDNQEIIITYASDTF